MISRFYTLKDSSPRFSRQQFTKLGHLHPAIQELHIFRNKKGSYVEVVLNEDNSDALELIEAGMARSLTLKPHVTDLSKERKECQGPRTFDTRCITYFDRATHV